ncbi:MAG: hypothetical protein HRT67_07160 [Flavobacteriaceae bacterium]|nr:hypothetical protein [Flavobacteriaceae bacterium]
MNITKTKKPIILAVLFLLPVTFLLFLYPSTHNYNALDIVKGDIKELTNFQFNTKEDQRLQDRITVLGFLGTAPNSKALTALNLKELIYDKFKGFKKFQVMIVVDEDAQESTSRLEEELNQHLPLKYWSFAYGSKAEIQALYNSLRTEQDLDSNKATDQVFIIDKERNQRGRLDDREEYQIEKKAPVYGLYSYDCIKVAELKNKMSEDMRILFTEYRQRRKGNFNSTSRRADDIKVNHD